MTEGADVSVIIPCYNQAEFLGDAVASARAQTRKPFEIIVVDDGSRDETGAVAANLDVVYVWQENRGLGAARNLGLRHAKAPLVVFLDSDDRLLPRALESGIAAIHQFPEALFVHGNWHAIARDGTRLPGADPIPENVTHDRRLWEQSATCARLLRGNYISMHATVMYRRAALVDAGGFNEQLRACEDWDAYLRLVRRGPIASHPEIVAEYRQHPHSMSSNSRLMLETAVQVLNAQRDYIRSDARLRQPFRYGLKFVREYYGELLAGEIGAELRSSGFSSRVWAKTAALVRLHPPAFLKACWRLIRGPRA